MLTAARMRIERYQNVNRDDDELGGLIIAHREWRAQGIGIGLDNPRGERQAETKKGPSAGT
jgi:hypothetical protein